MKHKVTVIICLVVVFVLGALCVQAWHDQRLQDKIQATKTAIHNAQVQQAQREIVQTNYNKVNAECKKGQVAWDALKVKTGSRPVCNLQMVQ